jgi:hypothetical protein
VPIELKTGKKIRALLRDGFRVCNPEPGRVEIHRPWWFGGGLEAVVTGRLADKLATMVKHHTDVVDYPVQPYLRLPAAGA